MDWVCQDPFPEGYSLFLDEDLSEPRRGIPSVARTAGRVCCFASIVFHRCLASIRSRGWLRQYGGLTNPTPFPCVQQDQSHHSGCSLPIHSQPLNTSQPPYTHITRCLLSRNVSLKNHPHLHPNLMCITLLIYYWTYSYTKYKIDLATFNLQ